MLLCVTPLQMTSTAGLSQPGRISRELADSEFHSKWGEQRRVELA
jgi:hypothetical protein